jgi:hypothetical protein
MVPRLTPNRRVRAMVISEARRKGCLVADPSLRRRDCGQRQRNRCDDFLHVEGLPILIIKFH